MISSGWCVCARMLSSASPRKRSPLKHGTMQLTSEGAMSAGERADGALDPAAHRGPRELAAHEVPGVRGEAIGQLRLVAEGQERAHEVLRRLRQQQMRSMARPEPLGAFRGADDRQPRCERLEDLQAGPA